MTKLARKRLALQSALATHVKAYVQLAESAQIQNAQRKFVLPSAKVTTFPLTHVKAFANTAVSVRTQLAQKRFALLSVQVTKSPCS